MAKPPFLKTKTNTMYHKYKCACIYKRNFEGISEIFEKDKNKGVCTKTESFCCTRVKRNYVRYLLTKKP